jgi:hypothetical protein
VAAILHGSGVLVNVPDPARYVWHNFSISWETDLLQVEALLDVLTTDRPHDVREMWDELGTNWQSAALVGLARIKPEIRERVLRVIGR